MIEAGEQPAVSGRMPVIFAGHGSPLNAIEQNRWSGGFSALREHVPRPAAILAISAHWFLDGTFLTGNAAPPTIHDFSGFPRPLYGVEYPSPGKPELAEQVRRLLGSESAGLRSDWGLDHGTWSVLRWMYPDADIPVIQMSIDRRLDAAGHFGFAQSLSALRDEDVLIFASGNVVHNLHDAFARKRAGSEETPDWAVRYDRSVADILLQRDTDALLSIWPDADDGRRAHPTPDHWLPMIYAYGATDNRDGVRFPMDGFDWGSISMRNAVFG